MEKEIFFLFCLAYVCMTGADLLRSLIDYIINEPIRPVDWVLNINISAFATSFVYVFFY